jgi:hypothetical protein
MKKLFLVALLVVAVLIVAASCAPAAPKMELPADAEQITPVVPQMGEHWGNMAQLGPQIQGSVLIGPVYMVYKGDVIGLEYMWQSEDRMPQLTVPAPPPEGEMTVAPLPALPVGVTVNYVDVTFYPEGHEQVEFPHWDMHLYFIPKAEVDAIMP